MVNPDPPSKWVNVDRLPDTAAKNRAFSILKAPRCNRSRIDRGICLRRRPRRALPWFRPKGPSPFRRVCAPTWKTDCARAQLPDDGDPEAALQMAERIKSSLPNPFAAQGHGAQRVVRTD